MDEQAQTTSPPQAGQHGEPHPDPHAGQAGQAGIDVERLADHVYHLFLAEARLAHARGERTGQRRKH